MSDISLQLQSIKESLIEMIRVNEEKVMKNVDFDIPIIQKTPDCVKVLDLDGKVLFMNYNGLCQMEIDDFENVKNKTWWSLWGSENENVIKESITKALKGECSNFTAFCPTAKGTPKWWDVSVEPLGNPIKQILSISRHIN